MDIPSWDANSAALMEPEGSLKYSQEPAAGPYPEPVEASPHNHFHLRVCLKQSILLSFPTKILLCISYLPHACYMSYQSHTPWFDQPYYT
jgi:hypothetical protein